MRQPIEIECEVCGAKPGANCTQGKKKLKPRIGFHATRADAALGMNRPRRMGRSIASLKKLSKK